jgi:hypothetical protein
MYPYKISGQTIIRGEEFSGVRIFCNEKTEFRRRFFRRKMIRSALKNFERRNLRRRTVRAKNSPAKNYPLSAKKNLGGELSGEELSASY